LVESLDQLGGGEVHDPMSCFDRVVANAISVWDCPVPAGPIRQTVSLARRSSLTQDIRSFRRRFSTNVPGHHLGRGGEGNLQLLA